MDEKFYDSIRVVSVHILAVQYTLCLVLLVLADHCSCAQAFRTGMQPFRVLADALKPHLLKLLRILRGNSNFLGNTVV